MTTSQVRRLEALISLSQGSGGGTLPERTLAGQKAEQMCVAAGTDLVSVMLFGVPK